MEFNPDLVFTTKTGSTYYVDQTMHTISGGALGNAVLQYTNNPSFFVGNIGCFELANGKILSTSAIESVHSHGRQNKPHTSENNKRIVCTTKSRHNYIIDLENKTITGGIFKGKTEKFFNSPNFLIGQSATIVTEQGVIRISPLKAVQTYDEFCARRKNALNKMCDILNAASATLENEMNDITLD